VKVIAKTLRHALVPPVGLERHPLIAYGLAGLMVAASFFVRNDLAVSFANRPLLIVFMPAIIVASALGGLGPGLFATAATGIGLLFVLLPPHGGWTQIPPHDLFQWAVLLLSGGLVTLLSEGLRRSRIQAEADRRLHAVTLASIGDAVLATDPSGVIVFLNPAAARLTGWTADAAVGQPLARVFRVVVEADRRDAGDPVGRVLASGAVVLGADHAVLIARDGREIPIRDSAAPIRLGDGRIGGVVVVFQDESGRRVAEDEVTRQRSQLRQVIDTLPDLVWLKDLDGRYLFCNRAFEAHFGASESVLQGRRDEDFVPPEMADWFRIHDHRALEADGPVSVEEEITLAEGERRVIVDTLKTPMRDPAGRVVGVLGVARDVTIRRQIEEELRLSIGRLGRIAATVPGMLYDFGVKPDGGDGLLYASDYCREIFEVEATAAVADHWALRRMMDPEDGERMRREQKIATEAGALFSCEVRITTPSGKRKWVQFSSRPVATPDSTGAIRSGVAIDVTERKAAEEARFRAEDLFRRMADLIGEVFWLATPDFSRLDYVSPAFETVWGLSCADLYRDGRAWMDAVEPDDRALIEASLAGLADGRPTDVEFRIRRPDGELRWIGARGYPLCDPDGRVSVASGVAADITDRRRARERLETAQAQLRLFVENAPASLAMLDCEMRYLIASRRWLTDYGIETLDEIVGRSHYEVFPEIPERWKEIHRRCLAGATEKCDEDMFLRADGCTDWLRWEIRPWYQSDRVVGGLLIMSETITEQVKAREQLRKLSQAVEQSPSGIRITDLAGRIEYVNDAFVAMSGYTREELIGAGSSIVSSGLTPEATHEEMWQAIAAGRPWEGEFINRRKSGEIYIEYSRVLPVRQDGGVVTHYLAIGDDITERKRIGRELELYRHNLEDVVEVRTAALQAAEARQRLILESSADGLYGLDLDGALTFINPSACAMLGLEADRVLGRPAHLLFHHSDAEGQAHPFEECPVFATLRDGVVRRVDDEVFWHASGRWFPVAYAVHPMMQKQEIIGVVVSFSDISAQLEVARAREAALAEAQRLAKLRRDFLANMSHEIRTPLNAVLGLAQIGRAEASGGGKTPLLFGRIVEAGEALLEVVDDILDFSKIEAGKVHAERAPLEVGAVIDRAVTLIAPRAADKGLELEIDEAPDLPAWVMGDALRLTQVLNNLLSNAVKFTAAGGRVRLAARREAATVCFEVSDTGIGISPDQIGRLFQPFEQADGSTTRIFGGTGLGLSISRHLALLMGGDIRVASDLGDGSRFSLIVPLDEAVGPPPPPCRSVALIGAGAELDALAASLAARGCPVSRLDGLAAVPEAEAVVVGLDVGADPVGRLMLRKLAQMGRRLAVVVDPGGVGVPAGLDDVASALERPVRARHVLAADLGTPRPPLGQRQALAGYRILAAEDNEVNRMVLEEILKAAGAHVTCVANGRLALDRVERDGAGAFDLVLADIQMPEMDGYDLARALHAGFPDLPVVGVTAHAMPEEEARCLAVGMVAHVTKPVRAELLVEAVVRHARRGGAPAGPPAGAPAGPPAGAPGPTTVAPPAAGAGSEAASVDWTDLDGHYAGRPDFVVRLLGTVLDVHAETPGALRAAAAAGDVQAIGRLAHKVRGSAGNLYLDSLRQLGTDTERAAAAPGEADPVALALALAEAVDALLQAIGVRRGAAPSAGGG